jgi:hypothetical protein
MSKTAPVSRSRSIANSDRERGESHTVPEHIIREFVGNLRLNLIHKIMSRLVVMSEIAEGLLAGELDPDYHERLRAATRELADEQASPFVEALVAAAEQGEEGLRTLIQAVNRALQLTVNYTSSELSEDASEEADQLRLAVFRQRQKHRSQRTSKQRPLSLPAQFIRTAGNGD